MSILSVLAASRWAGSRPPDPTSIRGSVLLLLAITAANLSANAQTGAGRIVFTSERDGRHSLFITDVDGNNPTRLTAGEAEAAVWSPDGCKIVFRRDRHDIYVMDADGANERLVARNADAGIESDLRSYFSPDGSRIVFVSKSNDIMVINADGSNVRRLTEDLYGFEPRWSPNGSKILFGSAGPRVQVMNADGTALQDLGGGYEARWSPDGSRIALQLGGRIAVMNTDGTNVRALTDDSSRASGPSWSPDGSRIAFQVFRDDDFVLEVMDADGTNRTKLSDQLMLFMAGETDVLSWSPDGSRVAFTRTDVPLKELGRLKEGGRTTVNIDIYTVDADGSNLRRLTTTGRNLWPTWSPTPRCERGP